MDDSPPPEILFHKDSLRKLEVIAQHCNAPPEEILVALIYWVYILKPERWLQIVRAYRDFHRP